MAITRPTGQELRECELTHIDRVPIDVDRAVAQHDAYVETLESLGATVVELPRLPDHPDAVFVEDTVVVLPEVAVLLRPGAPSRRREVPSMAEALADYRECSEIPAPATIDGGDVIVLGRRILVGKTTRSNPDGASALGAIVSRFGYEVVSVPVHGVLHLKSAVTAIDDETLIAYPSYVDLSQIDANVIEVHLDEPQGANVVRIGDSLLMDASAPQTIAAVAASVDRIVAVEVDEFAKAEGAISCKGVIFEI